MCDFTVTPLQEDLFMKSFGKNDSTAVLPLEDFQQLRLI